MRESVCVFVCVCVCVRACVNVMFVCERVWSVGVWCACLCVRAYVCWRCVD